MKEIVTGFRIEFVTEFCFGHMCEFRLAFLTGFDIGVMTLFSFGSTSGFSNGFCGLTCLLTTVY
jgi:hypothetical protein